VFVAIATGRSFALTQYFVEGLRLNGPQITYNGAIIVDPVTGRPIFLQGLPISMVTPVLEFLRRQGVYACYYTEDDIYVLERSPLEVALVPPGTKPPLRISDFGQVAHLPAIKLVAVANRDTITTLRPLADAAFGGELYVTRTSSVLLEFLHPSVSKGAALQQVIQSLGLNAEQVIAFGDSHNDIELLQIAGTGVAMGNAEAEARDVADIVAPSNADDGVAKVLDDLMWIA
jgi:Cof subfamily protein (haloacid dehalogenase superfamily)